MSYRSFFPPKNTYSLTFLFTLILLFISDMAIADNSEAFFELSTSTNQSGMLVLAAWAIANIVIGIFGWKRKEGAEMYFHQMNFFWNIVNLAIAGYTLFQFTASDPSALNFTEALGQHLKTKNLFIINAGLDIIYIFIGLYLLKRAGKPIKKPERLKGFGRSIVLQGSFLFVFDLIMYVLQLVNESKFPEMF